MSSVKGTAAPHASSPKLTPLCLTYIFTNFLPLGFYYRELIFFFSYLLLHIRKTLSDKNVEYFIIKTRQSNEKEDAIVNRERNEWSEGVPLLVQSLTIIHPHSKFTANHKLTFIFLTNEQLQVKFRRENSFSWFRYIR